MIFRRKLVRDPTFRVGYGNDVNRHGYRAGFGNYSDEDLIADQNDTVVHGGFGPYFPQKYESNDGGSDTQLPGAPSTPDSRPSNCGKLQYNRPTSSSSTLPPAHHATSATGSAHPARSPTHGVCSGTAISHPLPGNSLSESCPPSLMRMYTPMPHRMLSCSALRRSPFVRLSRVLRVRVR